MIASFFSMFSYAFIIRAFIVGIFISLCSSILGVNLVLKKYSMIGDGLSHVGFGSLALATALGLSPLKVTIPIVIIAAFFLLKISNNNKIEGDSLIALLSTASLAIGITSISITSGVNTDINNYLFGSILAMSNEDVILSILLTVVVLFLYFVFYNKIFSVTFDETFAKATGIKVDFYNMILAILIAVTIVVGMRMMGSLLITSLIIFPAMTSMNVFNKFKYVIIFSGFLSVICCIFGIILSFVYSIPTGASIVLCHIFVYILFSLKKN